jgi:integrase
MASLTKVKGKPSKKTGVRGSTWRVDFFLAGEPQRKSVRLGTMAKQQAITIKSRIEYLVAAKDNGNAPDAETSRWLASIGDDLHAKLAKHELVSPRLKVETRRLEGFLDEYIARRSDTKKSTRILYGNARRNLVDFFGADRPLDSITPAETGDWRRWLAKPAKDGGQGLAPETVRQRCRLAKQFFRDAEDRHLISTSPFAKMKGVSAKGNRDNDYFVTCEEVDAVLKACPDALWRLMFALSRFAGLRCPSEHLSLCWGDINWKNKRMLVHSPKTEHHEGQKTRTVPLFAELVPYLEAVRDELFASDFDPKQQRLSEQPVISRWRNSEANLRTRMHEIIRAAGLEPWPKVFQALRSTRRTELQEHFPDYVLNAWFGHSSRIAERHYLQVRAEHFDKATQTVVQTENQAQHRAQQQATQYVGMDRNSEEDDSENPGDSQNRRDSVGGEVGAAELESATSCMSSVH